MTMVFHAGHQLEPWKGDMRDINAVSGTHHGQAIVAETWASAWNPIYLPNRSKVMRP